MIDMRYLDINKEIAPLIRSQIVSEIGSLLLLCFLLLAVVCIANKLLRSFPRVPQDIWR